MVLKKNKKLSETSTEERTGQKKKQLQTTTSSSSTSTSTAANATTVIETHDTTNKPVGYQHSTSTNSTNNETNIKLTSSKPTEKFGLAAGNAGPSGDNKMQKFETQSSKTKSMVSSSSLKSSTSSSSSPSKSQHYQQYGLSRDDYRNANIISSIDLLESEKKEPIFSVPIDVVEIGTIISSSSSKKMMKSSSSELKTSISSSAGQFIEMESSSSAKAESLNKNQQFAQITSSTDAKMTSSSSATNKYIGAAAAATDDILGYTTKTGSEIIQSIREDIGGGGGDGSDIVPTRSSTARGITSSGGINVFNENASTSTSSSYMTSQQQQQLQQLSNEATNQSSLTNIRDNQERNSSKLSRDSTGKVEKVYRQNENKKDIQSTATTTKSSTSTATATSTSTSKKEVYDAKTKTWTEYDVGKNVTTVNKKHPTFERYVSQESDGTYKITYKKKIFDRRNNNWKVIEEKVVDSGHDVGYPEIVDDVINTTTTTYTTKIYDSKLGKWKVVDEKSYFDSKAFVPNDIAREIEKDNTDVANITTTTEVTKVKFFVFYVL